MTTCALGVRPDDQERRFGYALMLQRIWIERAGEDCVYTYVKTAILLFYRSAGYLRVGLLRVDDTPNAWASGRRPAAASAVALSPLRGVAPADQGLSRAGSPDGGSQSTSSSEGGPR